MRIERRGKIEPLTPRFKKFLVEALAGQSLDEVQAPSERRADYSCLRGLVAIELKSLEEDASERLSNLMDGLRKRDDWPEFYGNWPVESILANLDHDADTVKQKTLERIGRAIANDLKKANKQLLAHTEKHPRKNVIRLVVLINEDHEIYDPATASYVIQKELARMEGLQFRYESIDAVMYLTERHATRVGDDVVYFVGVFHGSPLDNSPWKDEVLNFIGHHWSLWNGVRHIVSNADAINSFVTIDHIPEQMRRQDLWRLQYRRNSYLRSGTNEQVRDRWDECMVISMFALLKDSPAKLSKEDLIVNMERFTHVMEEAAQRGIALSGLKPEADRFVAAGRRIGLSPEQEVWLAANVADFATRTGPTDQRNSP